MIKMLQFFEFIATFMVVTGQVELEDECSYIQYKSGIRNVAVVLEQCNCLYQSFDSYSIKTCSIIECSPDDTERIRVIEWNNTNNCYDGDLIKNVSVKVSSYLSSDNSSDLDYDLYCNKNNGNSKQCGVVYRAYETERDSNASYCDLSKDFYSDTYTLGEFCYGPLYSSGHTSYKTNCNGSKTYWSSGNCSGDPSYSINVAAGDCYEVYGTYWTNTILQSTCDWDSSYLTTTDESNEPGEGTSSGLRVAIGVKEIIALISGLAMIHVFVGIQ